MSRIKAYLEYMRESFQLDNVGQEFDSDMREAMDTEEYHQWLDSLNSSEGGLPNTNESNSNHGEK